MTIKLSQAINLNGAIVDLVTKDKENKLVFPSSVRYRFADALSSLKPALESYQKDNNTYVEKYGEDKEGKGFKVVLEDSPNWELFKSDMLALLDRQVDVKVRPITEAELAAAETKDYRVDVASIISLRELGLLVESPQTK